VNQQVFLRLHPYQQTSVATRRALKLAPRFYGPFTVLRRVGAVAYELDLPATSRIHPVFHVSQFKPKLGANTSPIPVLLPVNLEGIIQPEPMAIWIADLGLCITGLSLKFWCIGVDRLRKMLLGRIFTS
jgi:hypothetical protein